jgi:hypothetical protein
MAQSAGSRALRAVTKYLVLGVIVFYGGTPAASAQNSVGGHFGVVFPIVTRVGDETVDIGDDFQMGFPMGITVRKSDAFAFDLEVVAGLDFDEDEPVDVPLTIHPGVLFGLGGPWTGGLRMAFDIGGASWGFTPLLNLGMTAGGQATFIEFVFPIRFQDDDFGETTNSIGFGIHLGLGF